MEKQMGETECLMCGTPTHNTIQIRECDKDPAHYEACCRECEDDLQLVIWNS